MSWRGIHVTAGSTLGLVASLLLPACSDDGGLGAEPIGTSGDDQDTDGGGSDPSGVSDSADPSDPSAGSQTESDSGPDETGGCGGCFDDSNTCVEGDVDEACGVLGESCVACEAGTQCAEGECLTPPACGPDNCDGCCDGDACITDTNAEACGSGGGQCTACPSDSTCDSGVCELPCALTCEGCCTDVGTCVESGEQSAAECGSGADACAPCDGGLDCISGECISAECAGSCDGCCDGDECLDGDSTAACGSDGSSCQPCADGTTCEATGCVPDPQALWDLVVVDGEVSLTDQAGDPWDSFNGLPDPYVTVDAVGASGESAVVDDTVFPSWNEAVLEGVTTTQLMGTVTIAVVDSDIGFDTTIGSCEASFEDEWFGTTFDAECSSEDFVAWTLTLSLVPSP